MASSRLIETKQFSFEGITEMDNSRDNFRCAASDIITGKKAKGSFLMPLLPIKKMKNQPRKGHNVMNKTELPLESIDPTSSNENLRKNLIELAVENERIRNETDNDIERNALLKKIHELKVQLDNERANTFQVNKPDDELKKAKKKKQIYIKSSELKDAEKKKRFIKSQVN